MVDASAAADEIERRTRSCGTPARAVSERAYLKSDLTHFGVTVSEIRRIAKELIAEHPGISHDELIETARALWSRPIHECRMAAMMLLELSPRLLRIDDLDVVESMVRDSRTWAYVDALAGDVAGGIVLRHPGATARLDRWAVDPNFWLRRSALLALIVPLKHGAPFDRFGIYADAMLEEREFFIRKAIGWVLRETSKQRPDEVYAWIVERAPRASGVTLREAVKYLDPVQRAAVLDASHTRLAR